MTTIPKVELQLKSETSSHALQHAHPQTHTLRQNPFGLYPKISFSLVVAQVESFTGPTFHFNHHSFRCNPTTPTVAKTLESPRTSATVEFCTLHSLIIWVRTSAQNSNKLKGGLMALRDLSDFRFVPTLLLYTIVGR